MYLKQYIGKHVTIDLHDTITTRQDKTLKLFYETDKYKNFIRNKLIAVDETGIWIEGFQETTVLYDDDMNELTEPKTEWITYHVFVRFEYIAGVFVVENPDLNEKKIGFVS